MNDELADAMTEIQTAHQQIDGWNFGIATEDDGHKLSLSERIADLCLQLERLRRIVELLVTTDHATQEIVDKAGEIANWK